MHFRNLPIAVIIMNKAIHTIVTERERERERAQLHTPDTQSINPAVFKPLPGSSITLFQYFMYNFSFMVSLITQTPAPKCSTLLLKESCLIFHFGLASAMYSRVRCLVWKVSDAYAVQAQVIQMSNFVRRKPLDS